MRSATAGGHWRGCDRCCARSVNEALARVVYHFGFPALQRVVSWLNGARGITPSHANVGSGWFILGGLLMTRLIALAAVLALAVAPLAAQDKAKPDDKPPEPALQKQYAELQKEFNAAMRKKLEATKDDAEREAVFQNLSVVGAPFAEKAVK